MNSDLEALLRSYDAFQEASEEDEETKLLVFEAEIEAVASRVGIRPEQLARMVRLRYPGWIRAQKRPPTIPPKA